MMEAGCVVAAVIENAASGPRGEPGSGDVLEGDARPLADLNKDEALPRAAAAAAAVATADNNSPTEERQPQETSTAMVRSDDITEHPAEPLLRACVSTASMKVKNMKKLTFPRGHFPRLAECAHFHYETVDFGNVQLGFAEGQTEGPKAGPDSKELVFLVQITCQARNWLVTRSYEDFRVLDKHLHLCIYDRRYSQLAELPRYDPLKDTLESVTKMLATYLSRFSAIADNKINCGPVLTWMETYFACSELFSDSLEFFQRNRVIARIKGTSVSITWIDNKGNHLLVSEEASINVPAIAAAHVTKRYTAQATDELTFEVGDIVSVIDMPPKEDTGWWRGKHGFQVGFFPCDCVELINDKIPPSVQSSVPKPVCKKHGKLVTFLRTFMKSRPPPQKLRQRGILRERVFGCDLGEHLHNSGHEDPGVLKRPWYILRIKQPVTVVKSCAEFIEKHGVVDGIYRLSGISSNIQKLRHEFDSEQIPDLTRDVFRQDIHSVGSLCKLYFRELPNPLLTYQLYDRFSEAVSAATDEERLVKIHNVIQQLPPPHYRTLEYLMRHLSQLATFSSTTNMHTKNLAIVWAPNLLRSRQIESACFSGTAAFMEVRIQSVVVEFILNNTEALFSTKLNAIIRESTGNNTLSRPKSLLVCSPSTKLLSLEEAQARTQAQLGSPATTPCLTHSDYIEVGEGPGALMGKFHTVIELPMESGKRPPAKSKKSPVGNWLSFFHLGKSHSVSKRKLKRHPSEPNEIKSIALPGGRGDGGTLRSTKSEESLTSLHNVEGEPPSYRRLRPRSTSEAVSALSRDELRKDEHRAKLFNEGGRVHAAAFTAASPPHPEDDIDLCPPAAGISTLDFDPMSFQCAPTPGPPHGGKWRKSAAGSSESEPISSLNNISCSPDVSPVLARGGLREPQLRKKSFKMQADVQAAAASAAASPPPLPSSPPPEEGGGAPAGVASFQQHCSPRSTASQASALTDLSQSAQNLPDPGTDRLMSSVSVLPPHPPLTSAARKLALALAESAQKASGGGGGAAPQRRQDRPPRPSALDLKPYPQEFCGPHVSQWPPSPRSPAETRRRPHPAHFLPAHASPEPPPVGADGQDSSCNFTPNVSPLGSGSLEDGGERPPDGAPPRAEPTYQSVGVSTPQSPAASPIYVNTDSINVFNFRSVLAEAAMPASVEEVLPRPPQTPPAHLYRPEEEQQRAALGMVEDVYSNHHHHHQHHQQQHHQRHRQGPGGGRGPAPRCPRPDALPHHLSGPKSAYRQTSESRHSTLGLRHPLSPQYRHYHRDEHLISSCQRQAGPWQRSEDRVVGHPAIRRARSFHAPQISHYKLAETEVLPPDTMFYVEQTSRQEAPYQRLLAARPAAPFHNLQHPGYAAYEAGPPDAPRYYVEPFQHAGIRHSQSYTVRSTRESGPPDCYGFSPRRAAAAAPPPPLNKELYIESRDTVVYEARDAEVFERVVYQPLAPENPHRRAAAATSPYEFPASPTDSRDIMHTRSKSDPGNACILSADREDGPPEAEAESGAGRHRSGAEQGPSRRIQIKESPPPPPPPLQPLPPLRRVPSLPERGCGNLKRVEHNDRSHARGHDPNRSAMSGAVNSYAVKPGILRRPGRSQSTRESRHYYQHQAKSPLEPQHLASFSTQPNRRTHSTKVRPTQYDHMSGYYAAPKPKATRSSKAAAGYLPGQSCMSPRGHRLLSKALGQEAFYHTALRSEAGVYE